MPALLGRLGGGASRIPDLLRQAGSLLRVEASAQDEHEFGNVFAGDLFVAVEDAAPRPAFASYKCMRRNRYICMTWKPGVLG
jgi:hypothetical protein